jgi:5'-3' exonuclease
MHQPVKKEVLNTDYYKNNPYIKKENDEYVLLVDGHTLLKICMANDTLNSRGELIGPVFTFLLKLKLMLGVRDFSHVYVFWDGDNSGYLRWNLYSGYKMNRGKQYSDYDRNINAFISSVINKKKKELTEKQKESARLKEIETYNFIRIKLILHTILEDLFIRQIFDNEDGTESDDLIAYFCLNKKNNQKIFIMTTDSDLYQLISESVIVYNISDKIYLHEGNFKEVYGIPLENVVLKKILIGDDSDNITGIHLLGDDKLIEHFPEVQKRPVTLDEILEHAKQIHHEQIKPRVSEKTGKPIKSKPPIKVIENIINGKTKDERENVYEINEKLINLKKPLIGKQIKDEMDEMMNSPLSIDDRNIENVYKIIIDNEINELKGNNFSSFFMPFKKLSNKEREFYKKCT